MKSSKLLSIIVSLVLLFNACQESKDPSPAERSTVAFITTWETTTANEPITIPTNSGFSYDYLVDWGDGSTSNETGNATHSYATAGTYQVKITGVFPAIHFGTLPDLDVNLEKIKSIDQWGNQVWQSMEEAFKGCIHLKYTATDTPDLSEVSHLGHMFEKAASFNGDIGNWDVSNVINMASLFDSAKVFNQDISSWDMSNVTDMSSMFNGAEVFNQDIGNWDVSNVTNMETTFRNAFAFNQDISGWDVSNVTNMTGMFSFAIAFNQDISSWDVSKVTNMAEMFIEAQVFNQDISGWNVSNVTNMRVMFLLARAFNQDLTGWPVGNVTNCDLFGFSSAMNPDDLPDFTSCTPL